MSKKKTKTEEEEPGIASMALQAYNLFKNRPKVSKAQAAQNKLKALTDENATLQAQIQAKKVAAENRKLKEQLMV